MHGAPYRGEAEKVEPLSPSILSPLPANVIKCLSYIASIHFTLIKTIFSTTETDLS